MTDHLQYFVIRPENRDIRHWPPSPSLTVAVLPYIRSAYNELYKYTFADLEKQWDQAVQRKPREGETAEQVAENRNERAGEGGGLLDIEIEIINAQEHQEHIPDPIQEQPNAEAAGQPEQGEPQVEAQAGQPPLRQLNGHPARVGEWEFRQNNISTAQVATTIIGALFFPAVSSLMGELLKVTLPRKWVTKPMMTTTTTTWFGSKNVGTMRALQASGLLQEKWGRSVVGGCLFVVLKDALILYCKWRKAKNQGKRRVLDYVKGR